MAKQPVPPPDIPQRTDATSPPPPRAQNDYPSLDSLSAIERTVMLVRMLEGQRKFAAGLARRAWDESFVLAELRWFHEQWDEKNDG